MEDSREKHYACAVIYRERPGEPGKIDVLLQEVETTFQDGTRTGRQAKFPGGMQRLPEDPISVTLTREIVEETSLRFSGELDLLWSRPVFDRYRQGAVDHMKFAFLVPFSECTGELRSEPLQDGNDLMYPPEWVPIEEAGRTLFRTHQPILLAALERFGLR